MHNDTRTTKDIMRLRLVISPFRGSQPPPRLKDVMFIPGLNENIVSVTVLEDWLRCDLQQRKGIIETHNHGIGEADRGSCEEPV